MVSFPIAQTASQTDREMLGVSANGDNAVEITDLVFAWKPRLAPVLNIPKLEIEKGQRMFIQGPSGSGKSTLLGLLTGVVKAQTGRIAVLGHRFDQMNGATRDQFRASHQGVIFQMFNLIPYLSVLDNVTLPCRFSRRRMAHAAGNGGVKAEALHLLSRLGIADPDLLRRPVTELSVGQQQRVAAARALTGAPEMVIADEPTSSLDAAHREAFIQLLFEECGGRNTTLIFVSHDTSMATLFDRTIWLQEINRAHTGILKLVKGER